MKILFLSDNFTPERNAPASRTHEHAVQWVLAGHEVTVITTAPNFPEGAVYEGYRNRWHAVEWIDGIRVVRVKSYIAANEGFIRRIADYLSFMVTGGIAALFAPRPDVLVSTSPQFFCAVAGWAVSRLRRLPWIFELRDLWPESIVAVGAMRRNWLIRLLERLELRMYRDANRVVTVTKSFKADLVRRGIDPEKIDVVLNGVDADRYRPQQKDQALVDAHDLEGRLVAGYLGTIGMAHALDKVIEAAQLLQDRQDIVFLIAGAGAKRAEIEAQVATLGLRNVRLLDPQPKAAMPALWSVHDVALIPLRNQDLFRTVIPSKMFEAMGMGIPILMSLPDGEATQLLQKAGAGVCVEAENAQAMADTLVQFADDPERLKKLSTAGLQSATGYTRKAQAKKMLGIFEIVIDPDQASEYSGSRPSIR